MKQPTLIMALLAVIPFYGFSQGVILNAGDIFTFEFKDFHFESHLPVSTEPYTRVLLGKQDFIKEHQAMAIIWEGKARPEGGANGSQPTSSKTDRMLGGLTSVAPPGRESPFPTLI